MAKDNSVWRGNWGRISITALIAAAIGLAMPMEASTRFVAVAAMFLTPDGNNNSWRLVLSRDDLDPDDARQIELNQQTIMLQPLKDK